MRTVLSLLISFLLIACSSRSKVKSPYFYLAEKDGQTIHILGTMHLSFHLDDFHPMVREKLDEAELVALEADEELQKNFTEIKAKKSLEYLTKNLNRPYPELSKKLSPLAWKHLKYTLSMDEVKKYLARNNLQVSPYEMNPALALVITRELLNHHQLYAFHEDVKNGWRNLDLKWIYYESFNVVDLEILKRARKNKQAVLALDTLTDDLVRVLTDFENGSLRSLENFYGNSRKMAEHYNRLREDYRSGKELDISEISRDGLEISVLRDRNEAWVPRFARRSERKIFVAVGAAHLQGQYSILKMIERRGFKVTRINLAHDP